MKSLRSTGNWVAARAATSAARRSCGDSAAAPASEAVFARAQQVIPGGVNSPVRAFRAVGGTPYFVARAEGPYVWDVEGHRLIDLVQSYGAVIAGHAHPKIVEAIAGAGVGARRGILRSARYATRATSNQTT